METVGKKRKRESCWVALNERKDKRSFNAFADYIKSLPTWEENCEAREITALMVAKEDLRKVGITGLNCLTAILFHTGMNMRKEKGKLSGTLTCDTFQKKIADMALCSVGTVKRKCALLRELGILYSYQPKEFNYTTQQWICHPNIYTLGPKGISLFWTKKRKSLAQTRTKNSTIRKKREETSNREQYEAKIHEMHCNAKRKLIDYENQLLWTKQAFITIEERENLREQFLEEEKQKNRMWLNRQIYQY